MILQLRSDVGVDDVRAVLTAVTNHHDALRRAARRAGGNVGAAHRRRRRSSPSWPPGRCPTACAAEARRSARRCSASSTSRSATGPVERTADRHAISAAARAVRRYLAISVHGIVGDNASREILLTDIFTAFSATAGGRGHRAATGHHIVARMVAALRRAGHASRGPGQPRLLAGHRDEGRPCAWPARRSTEPPGADDLVRLSSTLTVAETGEIDDARRRLRLPIEEILLAALGRTIAATVGDGAVAVDLGGPRPFGAQTRRRPAPHGRLVHHHLSRAPRLRERSATSSASQLLDDVHDTLNAVPHYGIGYGLLRYMYAPTARLLGARALRRHLLLLRGHDSRAAVGVSRRRPCSSTPTRRCRCARRCPGLGHAIELRVYRTAGVLHLDWWYDSRRLEPADGGIACRAVPGRADGTDQGGDGRRTKCDSAGEELALVDLS